MTTKAIEAGARAMERHDMRDYEWTDEQFDTWWTKDPRAESDRERQRERAQACIEAAIASGALVPTSAVAAERERCATVAESNCYGSMGKAVAKAIRALEPAVGEYVLGWQTMDSAPKDGTDILVLVEESGEQFVCYFDGSGWRYATFPGGVMICAPDYWKKLDTPPVTAATSNGSGK